MLEKSSSHYASCSAVPGCFLCTPEDDLTVIRGAATTLISGLGPVVQGYCIVATKEHSPSLADIFLKRPEAISELVTYRALLQEHLGPILLTEHGRVPVCRDDSDDHECHCFHAHALLFPTVVAIHEQARTYYARARRFSTLPAALEYAVSAENYLLLSSSLTDFEVLSHSLGAPRQLARTLVANACGALERADWRTCPQRCEAVENAKQLRGQLLTK